MKRENLIIVITACVMSIICCIGGIWLLIKENYITGISVLLLAVFILSAIDTSEVSNKEQKDAVCDASKAD